MTGPARSRFEMRAVEAAERIRRGSLTSVELVTACLNRIDETDGQLRAWLRIDRQAALDEAKQMDSLRQRGLPLGLLHGVPVAIDALLGAMDSPASGRPGSSGNAPESAGSAVVERLREAGAVIVGKTRSTGRPLAPSGVAINPRDVQRSAGVPCGGAAAAVGACQVPLAVACESGGGVVRSASYCGVFGFRPTRGIVSRRGALSAAPTLDQVGLLCRDLGDAALLSDVLAGYDAADKASYLRPRPRMLEGFESKPPVEPDFIWLDMPCDEHLSPVSEEGFEELRSHLGEHVVRLPAPAWFGRLPAAHRVIDEYEVATWCRAQTDPSDSRIPDIANRGPEHGEERYRAALHAMEQAQAYFSEFFNEFDAVIAPAAAGPAPSIGSGSGAPTFCRIWALCGLPSLCVPLLEGEAGLPVGVQFIGSANGDDRLLRSARWLIERIRDEFGRHEAHT